MFSLDRTRVNVFSHDDRPGVNVFSLDDRTREGERVYS